MRGHLTGWTALPLILAFAPGIAAAQTPAPPAPVPTAEPAPPAEPQDEVAFSADSVEYDRDSEVVTASGQVRLSRDGNYVAADQVAWNRSTGQVVATGNVVVVNPAGDKLVGERVVLTDELREGTIDNLLVVLESGGRLAAARGSRASSGVTTLDNAVYSPCPVTSESGCPQNPKWKITAARVVYDPTHQRVRFERGRLDILGITLPLLPIVSIGTGPKGEGVSGLLLPEVKISRRNGLELAVPYHFSFAPNRDLTVTPHVYTRNYPGFEAKYRQLTRLGAFQLGGFATYGDTDGFSANEDNGFRAYLEGYGKAQFDPLWSLTGQGRFATDKTVARRYDITREDKLRSFLNLERIDTDSYISIAGWAFQGLRESDRQAAIPFALPAIDARWRLDPPAVGGKLELQANSLAILRRDGQDTQRAFASARWDRRSLIPWGQELLLTAYGRGDAYHSDETGKTSQLFYRGAEGWQFRGIAAAAAEVRWPLIGPLFGGVQRLTPRFQVVLTPPVKNLAIPNEDSRSVDLEDSNLFALNRFPGYDRWEDGSRATYGLDWFFERPNFAVTSTVGQSFRLTRNARIFPDGTGLTDRWSDLVGRTRVQFGRFLDLTHRFRVDKDNLGVRRNELDFTVGTAQTYARVGYLRLNRNIDPSVEDLRDKEELRFAGRWKFLPNWSLFGATVLDLTDREEDPLSFADGFEPVRHRASIDYEDECLEVGLSWRRDYERLGEGREGDTFLFRISLKGLGR